MTSFEMVDGAIVDGNSGVNIVGIVWQEVWQEVQNGHKLSVILVILFMSGPLKIPNMKQLHEILWV